MKEILRRIFQRKTKEQPQGLPPKLDIPKKRIIDPEAEPDRARLEAFRLPGVVNWRPRYPADRYFGSLDEEGKNAPDQ